MARDSFLFKKSWMLAIDGYASNVRCEFYEAVLTYLSCGRTVDLVSGGAKRAFSSVKKDIDAMNEANELRMAYITAVRRVAGRKGGEANGSKQKQTEANAGLLNSSPSPSPSPSRTRIEVNQDNIDYKNINSKKKKENAEKKDKEAEDNFDNRDNFCNREELQESNHKVQSSKFNVQSTKFNVQSTRRFIDFFNSTLEHAGAVIPHRCVPTEKRVQALQARVREHGKAALKTMVEKAAASPFLNGSNDRAWVATLDWLLRPNNFVKVIEGNYDAIQNSEFKNQNSKFNVQSSMFKVNGYGKTQQSDSRRGVDAQKHSADEY